MKLKEQEIEPNNSNTLLYYTDLKELEFIFKYSFKHNFDVLEMSISQKKIREGNYVSIVKYDTTKFFNFSEKFVNEFKNNENRFIDVCYPGDNIFVCEICGENAVFAYDDSEGEYDIFCLCSKHKSEFNKVIEKNYGFVKLTIELLEESVKLTYLCKNCLQTWDEYYRKDQKSDFTKCPFCNK